MRRFTAALLGAPLLASAHSDAVNTAEYFPFRKGDTWAYTATVASPLETKVCQFLTQTTASGSNSVMTESQAACSNGDTDYASDVYFFNRTLGTTTLTRHVKAPYDRTFSPPYLFLPSRLGVGETFSSSGTCGTDCTYTSTAEMLVHSDYRSAIGVLDSIQVRYQLKIHMVSDGHVIDQDRTEIYWMSKGVGEVKRNIDDSFTIDGVSGLVANHDITLVSFTGDVDKKDDGDDEDCSKYCGHPIDLTTGNLFEVQEDIPSFGSNIPFARYYNSRSSATVPLGQGWTHSYLNRVRYLKETDKAVFERADGKTVVFSRPVTDGPWTGNEDLGLRLVARYSDIQGDNVPIGWFLSSVAGELEVYDRDGYLTGVHDPAGTSIALSYKTDLEYGKRLSSATNTFGRALSFTYTGAQLTAVTGEDDRIGYRFDSATGFLSTLEFKAASTSRTYRYDESAHVDGSPWTGLLTSLRDENQDTYVSWFYDAKGRAWKNQLGNGASKVVITYPSDGSSMTVSVGDAAGETRTVTIASVYGARRPTSQSSASNSSIMGGDASRVYFANGGISERVDFVGNKTCYVRNDDRRVDTLRVEGFKKDTICPTDLAGYLVPANTAQRKITTKWHPHWRLKTRVAEPNRITTIVYHGQPDPLNNDVVASCVTDGKNLPDGRPMAVVCKRYEVATADDTGTLGFTAAETDRRVWSYEYDKYGHVTKITDPRQKLTKLEYWGETLIGGDGTGHTLGDLKAVTTAAGLVTRYQRFNKRGQPLTITLPNGVKQEREYTPRGWLSKVTERAAGGGEVQVTQLDHDNVGQLTKVTQPDGSWIEFSNYDAAHRLTEVKDSAGNKLTLTLDDLGNSLEDKYEDASLNVVKKVTRTFNKLNRLDTIQGVQ